MNKERLQEIKDSISLQYKVQEANDLDSFNIFTDEEQELVEEIERLNNIINKAIEYIKNNAMYSESEKICCDDLYTTDCDKVLEILDKV